MSYQTGNCEAPPIPRAQTRRAGKPKAAPRFIVQVKSNPDAEQNWATRLMAGRDWRKWGRGMAREVDAQHEADKVNRTYYWLIARVVPA